MIDSYRLAQKLHHTLVLETSKLQQRIILIESLRARFGDEALPPEPLLLSYNNALSNASETTKREIERAVARIAENVETIKELERMFADKQDADIRDFAQWVKSRQEKERAD
jgi:hypothetical protein